MERMNERETNDQRTKITCDRWEKKSGDFLETKLSKSFSQLLPKRECGFGGGGVLRGGGEDEEEAMTTAPLHFDLCELQWYKQKSSSSFFIFFCSHYFMTFIIALLYLLCDLSPAESPILRVGRGTNHQRIWLSLAWRRVMIIEAWCKSCFLT